MMVAAAVVVLAKSWRRKFDVDGSHSYCCYRFPTDRLTSGDDDDDDDDEYCCYQSLAHT